MTFDTVQAPPSDRPSSSLHPATITVTTTQAASLDRSGGVSLCREEKRRRRAPPSLWGRKSERWRIADSPHSHERKMQPGATPRIDLDQRRGPTPRHARSGWSAIHQSPSVRSAAADPTGSADNSITPPLRRYQWGSVRHRREMIVHAVMHLTIAISRWNVMPCDQTVINTVRACALYHGERSVERLSISVAGQSLRRRVMA
jgi:hypothetical protein